jgi:hypothetical protein
MSRRAEALQLSEELLSDIELSRLPPTAIVRKVSRLARLLDDTEAMNWLRYETAGYPVPLDTNSGQAAFRSHRQAPPETEGGPARFWTISIAEAEAEAEGILVDLSRSDGTASGDMAIMVERERAARRNSLIAQHAEKKRLLDAVLSSIHLYVGACYQELRFGSAVESAFELVRDEVDGAISAVVPDAMPMLASAFERATSDNPEDWAGAAGTCRRLLKTVADVLRPPGEDVDGRKMGDPHYINRLVNWIENMMASHTTSGLVIADLEHLGQRLDAVDGGGQKGAHSTVSRVETARYVAGTYLLLGDLLRLGPALSAPRAADAAPNAPTEPVAAPDPEAEVQAS